MRADVVAYSAAISACKKGAAWQSALELLQHMPLGGRKVEGDISNQCLK